MPSSEPDPQPEPTSQAPEPATPAVDAPPAIDPRRVLAARRLRLLEAELYLVIGPLPGRDIEHTVLEAIEGGVDIVQLRAKDASDEEIIAIGERLARLCHDRRVLFIVNDRPDLVEPIGADGVHVGQDDLSVAEARRIAGPSALVGVSTHDEDQLAAAATDRADYAGVGPVHETPTKPGRPATGYRLVHHASLKADVTWFAIGGIDAETVDRTLASGAERIVVVRAIAEADDPRAAAAELRQAINDRPRRSTSEERDAAVRADLRPFEPGERPAAAAMAAILIAAIGGVNLLMLAIGYQPREAINTTAGKTAELVFGVGIIALAYYVWQLKAWALLLLQALLALTALASVAGLVYALTLRAAFLTVIVLTISGVLFYKLIRVLARAQAPPVAAEEATEADEPATETIP